MAFDWIDLSFIDQEKLEKSVLDRILYTREILLLQTILTKQVDETYFISEIHQKLFLYIKQYYNDYSDIPSEAQIDTLFTGYVVNAITDNINKLVDELIRRWTQRKNQELISQITQINSKTWEIPLEFLVELQKIHASRKRWQKWDFFISWSSKFVDEYEEKIKNKEEFTWIKIWLPYIDNEFGWIQKTDFIWLLADEKKWKSWIMLWIAYQIIKQWKRVLFISPEMDNDEVLQRLHLIHTNFNSTDFYQWKLTDENFQTWREKNKTLKELLQTQWAEFVSIDDIALQDMNITTIKARLKTVETQMKNRYMKSFPNLKEYYEWKEHLFDCLIIDGFHMLNGSDLVWKWASEWKESQKVSQSLRSFARIEKIPVLVSLHTNRDKQKEKDKLIPDQADTSMTASLWRDVTLLLSLFSNPTMQAKNKLWMASKISRRSAPKIWTIDFDPNFWKIVTNENVKNEKDFMDDLNAEDMK